MALDQPFQNMDDFYGDGDAEVKYKLRHFGKFRILLIITCVLAVLCCIFIVLFAVEKSRSKAPSAPRENPVTICNTRNCLFTATDMLQQINQSVDPCEDFYQYACGGWIDKNPLKEGETSRTGFSVVSEKNYDILKAAIESSWMNYDKNEAVMKTARFYNSCINEKAVETEGDVPLLKFIQDFGGWHVSGSNVTLPLFTRLAKMNQELRNRPLFSVRVFINPHDSNKHVLMFDRSATVMTRDYYTTDTAENLKVREAYKQYMKDVAKLLGGKNDSDALMMQVYEFEAKLARIEKTIYGPSVTIEELMKKAVTSGQILGNLTPTLSQFTSFLNISVGTVINFLDEVFTPQKFKFKKDDLIFGYPLPYFIHLFALYANQTVTDPKVLDNYAMWTAVHQYILASPSKFVSAYQRYVDAIVGNQTSLRWRNCLKQMQSVLKMPLGLLFVNKAFDEKSKATVREMTHYIRQAFLDNLDGITWMDSYTKMNAKAKAEKIVEDIGYPEYIKDPTKLADEIKGFQVGDKLFENVRKMVKFAVQGNMDDLHKEVDRDKWLLGPSQTNGYYAVRQNRIVFLAGILQPPFYNSIYPNYLTYGGIGMVIGHEITHGFDGSGRMYDKNGNINNWWSQESGENFMKRSKCLVNQYSNFEIFGAKINGNKTLNENIADNGGIKFAYEGYKAWSQKNGMEGVLPGLGLTVDQLFFIGFAQPWCSKYTKKPALAQIQMDTHANSKYRVLGSLQNYQKFSEVFQCKKGSYMNPEKKCKVW